MRKKLLYLLGLTLVTFSTNAQAPVLSETKSQIYALGTEISPLLISNSGGAIPTSVYSNTITLAGKGSYGSLDGSVNSASFNGVSGVAVDLAGNVYAADTGNNKIRKINTKGEVISFAGNGTSGSVDGIGSTASFDAPYGLTVDALGNIYVADSNNNKIRKITPAGIVTTFAGNGILGSADGIGTSASFNHPYGLAVDKSGNVYVADTGNHKIRKITPLGVVTTLAGTGNTGSIDGRGIDSSFKFPFGVAVSGSGNIYVADSSNNKIRKIGIDGEVTTFAGNGNNGANDGNGTLASFKYPSSLVVDASENIYVADTYNHKIRKISFDGKVKTISGNGNESNEDGENANAGFDFPCGIAIDRSGSLYVADYLNNKVRKISIFGYTVEPALPVGLSLDSATGIISGTPTVLTQASDYILKATNAAGSSTAKINIAVIQRSIISEVAKANLGIYPNPANTTLNINNPENLAFQNLKVIDVYGKVILETANTNQINIQSLDQGVYILKTQTQEHEYQMKFIKS